MSKWPGKYVIGLTGNIATGKSVVRRMLEHLGAYGIDADALAHRAIAKGAPGYKPVVETFGKWLLDPDQQINRGRLGNVAFADPHALSLLEGIVHPLVNQAVDLIIQRSSQRVVVIEAIKLLESSMASSCDSIWVSYSPPEVQLDRLMTNRKMNEREAQKRITVQPPQEQKIKAAQVVIRNSGSFEDTWRQVVAAWQSIIPDDEPVVTAAQPVAKGELNVVRGQPRHSKEIAEFITQQGKATLSRVDIMAAFGEKAFLLLMQDNRMVGVVGWQVENLVARTTDVHIDAKVPAISALPALLEEVERASRDLQCEASLLFVNPDLARLSSIWKDLGYEVRTPQTLKIQAWQEAAVESMPAGTQLLFKQLRTDRVLRPI